MTPIRTASPKTLYADKSPLARLLREQGFTGSSAARVVEQACCISTSMAYRLLSGGIVREVHAFALQERLGKEGAAKLLEEQGRKMLLPQATQRARRRSLLQASIIAREHGRSQLAIELADLLSSIGG